MSGPVNCSSSFNTLCTFIFTDMIRILIYLFIYYFLSSPRRRHPSIYPSLINIFIYHIPVCTPLGFVRLFGVVGQVLVKPHLLRDVDSEFDAFNMEEASVRRKLAATKDTDATYGHHPTKNGLAEPLFVKVVQATTTTTIPNGVAVNNTVQINNNSKLYNRVHLQEHKYEASFLHERLREIEADKNELGGWNLFYLFILAYYDGTTF